MRNIIESQTKESFSQVGEDRIIDFIFSILGPKRPLTYIDIGAANPIGHNNTYLFYSQAGNGIIVDADPQYASEYSSLRPRDICYLMAIVPIKLYSQDVIKFFRMENRGWSTVSIDHKLIGESLGKSSATEELEISCMTINQFFELNMDFARDFDLLSIDIEGVDIDVVCDIDFNRFKPKTIILELSASTSPHLRSRVETTLKDYCLFASTYVNSIYVRKDILISCVF